MIKKILVLSGQIPLLMVVGFVAIMTQAVQSMIAPGAAHYDRV